jgi:hypothetical protein
MKCVHLMRPFIGKRMPLSLKPDGYWTGVPKGLLKEGMKCTYDYCRGKINERGRLSNAPAKPKIIPDGRPNNIRIRALSSRVY